jgi:hypothetical protein
MPEGGGGRLTGASKVAGSKSPKAGFKRLDTYFTNLTGCFLL